MAMVADATGPTNTHNARFGLFTGHEEEVAVVIGITQVKEYHEESSGLKI